MGKWWGGSDELYIVSGEGFAAERGGLGLDLQGVFLGLAGGLDVGEVVTLAGLQPGRHELLGAAELVFVDVFAAKAVFFKRRCMAAGVIYFEVFIGPEALVEGLHAHEHGAEGRQQHAAPHHELGHR